MFLLIIAALTVLMLSAAAFDFAAGHRRLRFLKDVTPAPAGPRVSIIVAARNEARGIEAAVTSLLGLAYPALEIISVNDRFKPEAVEIARRFASLGFHLVATRGTAAAIRTAGLECKVVFKVNEGRPNAVDLLKAGQLQLVIYTSTGAVSFSDEKAIRRGAVTYRVPCITTMSGARASADAVAGFPLDREATSSDHDT